MAKYLLPHFGELDTENLQGYYEIEIVLNGRKIKVDLNFDGDTIDITRLRIVEKLIDNIFDSDMRNRQYIEQGFVDKESDTIKTYIDHHLEEIDKKELSNLVDFDNEIISPEVQLISALKLIRVGLYPDNEEQFAVFDYSIGVELTQYLLVITTDMNDRLKFVTMES